LPPALYRALPAANATEAAARATLHYRRADVPTAGTACARAVAARRFPAAGGVLLTWEGRKFVGAARSTAAACHFTQAFRHLADTCSG